MATQEHTADPTLTYRPAPTAAEACGTASAKIASLRVVLRERLGAVTGDPIHDSVIDLALSTLAEVDACIEAIWEQVEPDPLAR